MKKVLVICLMMLMAASICLTAFAADGGFLSSPSGNAAPTLVSVEADVDISGKELIITAYGNRNELSDKLSGLMETAYNEIKNCDDLTKLNSALAKLASKKKINGKDLAVSDLFDLHVAGSDFSDDNIVYRITLEAETLNNFVGLLHMNQDGDWELVENAEITSDGYLKFSADSFSPFAVVVNTNPPKPGDNSRIYVYAIIMVASALALIFVAVKSRKQKQRV